MLLILSEAAEILLFISLYLQTFPLDGFSVFLSRKNQGRIQLGGRFQ